MLWPGRHHKVLADIAWYMSCSTTKQTKSHVRLDQPGHPASLMSTLRNLGSLATNSAYSGCPGWSESSLGAHATLLVLSCCGSYGMARRGMSWYVEMHSIACVKALPWAIVPFTRGVADVIWRSCSHVPDLFTSRGPFTSIFRSHVQFLFTLGRDSK